MEIKIDTPGISFNSQTDTFSAELSDLRIPRLYQHIFGGSPITLINPKSGGRLKATWVETHRDASGEDIYGWLYHAYNPANGRNIKFLFIND